MEYWTRWVNSGVICMKCSCHEKNVHNMKYWTVDLKSYSTLYDLLYSHDDIIKWKHFLHYWPFVWGIHRSPVNSPPKGQCRGALIFSLTCFNKRLYRQSRHRWFEVPLRSLWRHCNALWFCACQLYTYLSGSLYWHLGSHMVAPGVIGHLPQKQPWRIWVNELIIWIWSELVSDVVSHSGILSQFNSLRPSDVYIYVSKLTIIGSDNGLSPGWRQAIIWTNVGILLIGPLATNFSEILIEIHTFSFQKNVLQNVVWKMAAILSQPQCDNIPQTCSLQCLQWW